MKWLPEKSKIYTFINQIDSSNLGGLMGCKITSVMFFNRSMKYY